MTPGLMLLLLCGAHALLNVVMTRWATKNKDYERTRLYILLTNLWSIAGILIAALKVTQ